MRSAEAQDYFRTLGQLYREARIQSKPEATQLLSGEKQTPEYSAALLALKFRNNHHFAQGVNSELTGLQTVVGTCIKTTTDRLLQCGSASDLKRWLLVYEMDEALTTFLSSMGAVRKQVEDSSSEKGGYATDVFVLGGRLQMRRLTDRWGSILGERNLDEDKQRALRLQRFAGYGSLVITAEGLSLSDFVEEDFRSKRKTDPQRIKDYLSFFMEIGSSAGDIDTEERIGEQNATPEAKEHPFIYRNLIREAHHIAKALYVFPMISPYKFARGYSGFPDSFRKNIEAITQFVINSQQQFAHFTGRVHELVFNPQLEGSKEIRDFCLSYINSENRFASNYLFSLMGIAIADPLVEAYRRSIDLAEAGQDQDFYQALSSSIEDAVERSSNLGIATIEDIEDITTQTEVVGKPEEGFAELTSTVQRLNTIPRWQDIDITEIAIPWEESGIKKPTTVKLDFPNGNPFVCNMELGYQSKAGDTLNIELKVDLKKKQFGWSVLQAPERYPDFQRRFLTAIKAIFAEIYTKLRPAETVQKVAEVVAPATAVTPKVRPPRPIRFVGPAEVKKTKPKGAETPIKMALLEQSEEHGIKDHILIPDHEALNALLAEIPNSQRGAIIRKMVDLNRLGRGRIKPLDSPGPNGEHQGSLRVGNYRVVLIEQEFKRGLRDYSIREIGVRRIIYDVVDN